MSKLTIYTNPAFGDIRGTLDEHGEPWFVGRDVAKALGYGDDGKAATNAVSRHVDPEDKGVTEIVTPGGKQKIVIINESGLYSLILSSKLPTAKQFKRWVTSEVLPAIRRHGAYMTPETIERALSDPDTIIKLATQLKEERERRLALETRNGELLELNAVQNQQIAEMRPKAGYYDVVLNCKDAVSVTVIAKDYGWSARRLNGFLHEKKVQFKQGNTWVLYQKYAEQGYTATKTQPYLGKDGEQHSSIHTYWTQKGRLFIYELMKKDGHLPLVEQKKEDNAE